ncbi:MAG: SDR family oxidoreductase [Bacteroidales bacterium]|nr:SDR family oxidoreductase [Bacteroidales bacterium]
MNVLLTGAGSGIGYQCALALCNFEVENLVLLSRNRGRLEKLKKECVAVNNRVNIHLLDFDLNEIVKSPQLLLNKMPFDKLDIVINNAGYLNNASFLEAKPEEIIKMFETNALSPFRLVRILFGLLNKTTPSHVVNIGSMGGVQGSAKFSGLSYYSASKAALACLTECVATELADTNISINCLALGAVDTEMLNHAFPGYKAPVSAKEMGEYIAGFALTGNKFYNGKVIPVSLSTP